MDFPDYPNWISEDGYWVDELTSNLPPPIPCPPEWLNEYDVGYEYPSIDPIEGVDDISDTESVDPIALSDIDEEDFS